MNLRKAVGICIGSATYLLSLHNKLGDTFGFQIEQILNCCLSYILQRFFG